MHAHVTKIMNKHFIYTKFGTSHGKYPSMHYRSAQFLFRFLCKSSSKPQFKYLSICKDVLLKCHNRNLDGNYA
jgi:hypothetical protein